MSAAHAAPAAKSAERRGDLPFSATPYASFNEPWTMSFLPDGSALISEKGGTLKRFDPASGRTGTVSGVPAVAYGGQ